MSNLKKSKPLPISAWCKCDQWHEFHSELRNYEMKYCIYCAKLNKE